MPMWKTEWEWRGYSLPTWKKLKTFGYWLLAHLSFAKAILSVLYSHHLVLLCMHALGLASNELDFAFKWNSCHWPTMAVASRVQILGKYLKNPQFFKWIYFKIQYLPHCGSKSWYIGETTNVYLPMLRAFKQESYFGRFKIWLQTNKITTLKYKRLHVNIAFLSFPLLLAPKKKL